MRLREEVGFFSAWSLLRLRKGMPATMCEFTDVSDAADASTFSQQQPDELRDGALFTVGTDGERAIFVGGETEC
jgi:hypothetical protein